MLQVAFCFSNFSEAFSQSLWRSPQQRGCVFSSTLSCVLAATLWVMGFFHSLFGNSTYDILPEQGSMEEYFASPEHGSMGEELLPEQSSTRDENSLSLGARLNEICSYKHT